eukprot:gene26899-4510_t
MRAPSQHDVRLDEHQTARELRRKAQLPLFKLAQGLKVARLTLGLKLARLTLVKNATQTGSAVCTSTTDVLKSATDLVEACVPLRLVDVEFYPLGQLLSAEYSKSFKFVGLDEAPPPQEGGTVDPFTGLVRTTPQGGQTADPFTGLVRTTPQGGETVDPFTGLVRTTPQGGLSIDRLTGLVRSSLLGGNMGANVGWAASLDAPSNLQPMVSKAFEHFVISSGNASLSTKPKASKDKTWPKVDSVSSPPPPPPLVLRSAYFGPNLKRVATGAPRKSRLTDDGNTPVTTSARAILAPMPEIEPLSHYKASPAANRGRMVTRVAGCALAQLSSFARRAPIPREAAAHSVLEATGSKAYLFNAGPQAFIESGGESSGGGLGGGSVGKVTPPLRTKDSATSTPLSRELSVPGSPIPSSQAASRQLQITGSFISAACGSVEGDALDPNALALDDREAWLPGAPPVTLVFRTPRDRLALEPKHLDKQREHLATVIDHLRELGPQIIALPLEELTILTPQTAMFGCFNLHCANRGVREMDMAVVRCPDCMKVTYCSQACLEACYQEHHVFCAHWCHASAM